MKIKAFAKINLFLEITGRRRDGYHLLSTLFQEISLADELSIEKKKWILGEDPIDLACPGAPALEASSNLAYRAARSFMERHGGSGYSIVLRKRIPWGAGLGGGSSDAAAVLRACWSLHFNKPLGLFPADKYIDLARKLGADVPFFLRGGACLARGVGEVLMPIPFARTMWFVLLKPRVSVSTKWAYQRLRFPLTNRRSVHKIKTGLARRGGLEWAAFLYNRLEEAVLPRFPAVARAKTALRAAGCAAALMSGSGSSVFGVVGSKQEGEKIFRRLKKGPWDSWLVRSLGA